MANCFVALGGNVGDVFVTMEDALSALDRVRGLRIAAVSSVYETTPIGPVPQPPYLNAAVRLECDLTPHELLGELHKTEERAGRERSSRWGERTLDLDLLLFDDLIIDDPRLTVPHPHLWYRRFVLDPLSEIAADVRHPVFNETIRSLRQRLIERPLTLAIVGGTEDERNQVSERVRRSGSSNVNVRLNPEEGEPPSVIFDLSSPTEGNGSEKPSPRHVRLMDLPGSIAEAAEFVLAAALDEPQRHNRPLRRMP